MIKVENVDIWGFEHAVRGMRNPLNSWAKSDSEYEPANFCDNTYNIGPNDLDLMRRLYKAGPEHRKYLRQIFVSMDITAPLYWASEFDTYKIGVVRNSCSFMHKGVSKPFEINDFSIHDDRVYEILSPIKKDINKPVYKDTDEYKIYTCKNGRTYKVYKNGKIIAEEFEYTDSVGRTRKYGRIECKPSVNNNGYYYLNLGRCERWLLHRLVATVWIDNPNNYATVNHIDGNKGNNNVDNLEWCSLTENIKKGFDNGLYDNISSPHSIYIRWKRGLRILPPETRSQLIHDYRRGMSRGEIVNKYEITKLQADRILAAAANVENEDLYCLCYYWERIIDALNTLRDEYLITKDDNIFQQIRCLLPCGYNIRYTVTMNYENVISMIKQRSGHKLDEWNDFVEILKGLPYIEEITRES